MSWFRKFHIPLPGAALALLAFFLPWLTVSCQGTEYSQLSGYDLASQPNNDFVLLWAVLAAAVISVLLVLLTMYKPEHEQKTAVGHIVASLVAIGIIAFIWYENVPDTGETLYEYNSEYGLWLTLIGLLIMMIGGIISFLDARQEVMGYEYAPYPGVMTQTTPDPIPVGEGPGTTSSGFAGTRADFGADLPPITAAAAPGPVSRPTEVLNRQPDALAWLVVKEGPRAGHTFRLMETTSIGRDAGNDIIIDDTSMSGQHARINLEEGKQFFLYDLASTNGVFAFDTEKDDWERVYRTELTDGRQIKLGRTVLHFMHLNQGTPEAKA